MLRWCLGSVAVGQQYGAVSALTFNKDCTRLLCGFAKGQVRRCVCVCEVLCEEDFVSIRVCVCESVYFSV